MKKNLVIIAALNEEEGIGPTIEELKKFLSKPHFLVVDGQSEDRTVEIAKEMGAEVLMQVGKGKGSAIGQAVRRVDSNADYVVFTDADFTYPAEYLPKMRAILDQNREVGMVTGNRFNGNFYLGSLHNVLYAGNRTIAFIHILLNGVHMHDPLTGLRVVRSEILKGWNPKSKGFDIEVELNHLVESKGYRIVEIPIYYRQRMGEKKLKLRHGLIILRRILLE